MEHYINAFITDKNKPGFKTHCSNFLAYIDSKGKADDPKAINKDDLIDFIGSQYEKKLEFENTMTSYLESIKALYVFLNNKYSVVDIFDSSIDFKHLKREILSKYSLKKPQQRGYLSSETIIDILKYFDLRNDVENIDFLITKIFIKILLIVPVKRSGLLNIKRSDFTDDFRILKVNEIDIDIPNSLRFDLITALKSRPMPLDDRIMLFDYLVNKPFVGTNFNVLFCKVLKEIGYLDLSDKRRTYSIEKIMNTTIFTLMQNGTNLLFISKISGVSLGSIKKKIKEYDLASCYDYKQVNESIKNTCYYKYI